MSNPLDNTDAEIRDHANTRVKELVNQMRGIRASMVTASAALVGFDAAGYSDMDGRVLMVRPEWTQLIERFDVCQRCNLRSAAKALDVLKTLDQLLERAISDRMTKAEDFFAGVQTCIQRLPPGKEGAFQGKALLEALEKDVAQFSGKLGRAFEQASKPIKAGMDQCMAELNYLQATLATLDEKIAGFGLDKTSPLHAWLANMNQFGILGLAATALTLERQSTINEQEEVIRDIVAKRVEISSLYGWVKPLETYKTEVDNVQYAITDAVSKGKLLTHIWVDINDRLGEFEYHFGPNTSLNGLITNFKRVRLRATKSGYDPIIFLLRTYVEQTAASIE